MTRQETVAIAQDIVRRVEASLPPGSRLVVVHTDEAGAWVGVGSNTTDEDVQAILSAALHGADRRDFTVVEAEAGS